MSLKNILLGALLGTTLVSCQRVQPEPEKDTSRIKISEQSPVVSIENKTRVTVKSVIIFSTGPNPRTLYNSEINLPRHGLQVIFLKTTDCVLTLQINYSDKVTQKTEKQNFCENIKIVLNEKDLYAHIDEKKRLLLKFFPKRFGDKGKQPIADMEDAKAGRLFAYLMAYAEKK